MIDNQAKDIVKEVAVYVAWLIVGFAISFFILAINTLLFLNTKRVPPNIGGLIIFPVILIVTYLLLKKKNKTFVDIWLSFTLKSIFPNLIYGLLLGALYISFTFAFLKLSNSITVQTQSLTEGLIIALLTSFAMILLQSGTEEVVFRGYLLRVLSREGQFSGAILTAALFSIAHFWQGLNTLGLFNIFLFGFFAAQLVFKSKGLWIPIGFHGAWNFFQMKVYGFPVYGNTNFAFLQVVSSNNVLLSGGDYGPEASLITTFLLSASIITLYLISKNTGVD